MTEHIEGDECKFALWTGTVAPISDYKVILRVRISDIRSLHCTIPLVTGPFTILSLLQVPSLYCPSCYRSLHYTVPPCYGSLHCTVPPVTVTGPFTVLSLLLQLQVPSLYCPPCYSPLHCTVPLITGSFTVLSSHYMPLHYTVPVITGPFTLLSLSIQAPSLYCSHC